MRAEEAIERAAAQRLYEGFRSYNRRFRELTRRAAHHFIRRDWAASRRDAVRRIDLYNQSVSATRQEVTRLLGSAQADREAWARIKALYGGHSIRLLTNRSVSWSMKYT